MSEKQVTDDTSFGSDPGKQMRGGGVIVRGVPDTRILGSAADLYHRARGVRVGLALGVGVGVFWEEGVGGQEVT